MRNWNELPTHLGKQSGISAMTHESPLLCLILGASCHLLPWELGDRNPSPSMLFSCSAASDCGPMDSSTPSFPVHGILQARIRPVPSPEDLPNSGIKPLSFISPALQVVSLPLSHQGSPALHKLSFINSCYGIENGFVSLVICELTNGLKGS